MEITGFPRNYAEFAVVESPGGMGQIRNIVYFKRLSSKLPESRGILRISRLRRLRRGMEGLQNILHYYRLGTTRSTAEFAIAESPGGI